MNDHFRSVTASKTMASPNVLFDLLQQDDFAALIGFLQAQKSDLKETFEIFTKAQSINFWNVVLSNVRSLMPTVTEQCNSANNFEENELEENLVAIKCVLSSLSAFCLVTKFKPPAVFDIILLSQGVLTCNKNLSVLTATKVLVSKLSELWWLNNEEGAENLMPQLITYLLMTTLGIDGHDVDIKRLYGLRGAFLLLDFENPSISFIRELIQRSFVHPSFLKLKEGQKLMAFLLNVNQGLLINLVASVIKPQLASGSKAVAGAYGHIFFLAWTESQAQKDEVEELGAHESDGNVQASAQALEDTIQGFLREGVHASEDKYFKGVRFMLQAFHDVQRSKLDAMLLRVYDPILWRSLRCANAQVRAQAAVVFLDVFPLQHADGRAEDNDKILQKQFDLLAALLTDSDQRVRAHAALGVCHILKEYWESLPLNTTHNILKFLIDTLSVDASCANVRYAVFVGLGELFQQPLTHTLLKQLLPLLRNSIHDKSEKVRVAFMKILCQVKGIRGMHFYDIVPVDHLLARMAADHHCSAVGLVMTDLLLNSFYPQAASGASSPETEQLNRCMQFISKEPVAAEVFYSHLHHFISIGQVAKLITVMFTFLVTVDIRSRAAGEEQAGDTAGADATAGGKRRRAPTKAAAMHLSFAEKLGLMRMVLKLLESVSSELSAQHLSRDLVAKYLTEEHTRDLLASSAACDSAQSVYLLPVAVQLVAFSVNIRKMAAASSFAGKAKRQPVVFALQDLLFDCFLPVWTNAAALENGKTDSAKAALAAAFVEVFSSADQEVGLLEAVRETLEVACHTVPRKSAGKKAASSRVRASDSAVLPFGAAVDLLAAFSAPQLANPLLSEVVSGIFALVRVKVEDVLSGGEAGDSDKKLLLRVLQLWTSKALHGDAHDSLLLQSDATGASASPTFPNVQEVLEWSGVHLLPRLCAQEHSALACRALGMVISMLSDLFYLDLHNEAVCATLRDWLCELHSRGKEYPVAFSRDTTAVLPSLLRISSLLSLGKDTAAFHVRQLAVATVNILLLRMDCAADEEKEGTAVLSLLDAVSLADATIGACLVKLVDELESQRETPAKDKPSLQTVEGPRSSSGAFLHAALVDAADAPKRAERTQCVLTGWLSSPGAVPYSARNPLTKVSHQVVLNLSQQLESVFAMDVNAQNSSAKNVITAKFRTENRFDDGNKLSDDASASLWHEI